MTTADLDHDAWTYKRLRYGGRCLRCSGTIERNALGWHNPALQKVRCEPCGPPKDDEGGERALPPSRIAGASASGQCSTECRRRSRPLRHSAEQGRERSELPDRRGR